MTSRRQRASNQRWNNVVFFNAEIFNVKQRRNNVAIFNIKFHNVDQRRNNVVNMTICRWLKTAKKLFELKVGLSSSQKIPIYLLQWKAFKNDEKCFLFHLKSFFHSQDIQIFILTLSSCRRNGLIRKKRLISKFLTSQPG